MKDTLQSLGYSLYEESLQEANGSQFAIARGEGTRHLIVQGQAASAFQGEAKDDLIICPLSVENAKVLGQYFDYIIPIARPEHKKFSMGFGDRLGLATPGHIQAIRNYDVFPVFAQQSIRELSLSKRNYEEVIAAASFAVFQTQYKEGFGGDGDHLKTEEEIQYALDCGMTMITLDCSEHIQNEVDIADYQNLDADIKRHYEERYLAKALPIIGEVTEEELQLFVLVFHKAVEHAISISKFLKSQDKPVNLEVSIDETPGETSPLQHYIIAQELIDAEVEVSSMAPHFSGAFEKGVDYQGDVEKFTQELRVHQEIAEYFGYRLSLHSGSDKFTVFPIWGEITKMASHVKVAGTNWLEALRVVAEVEPELFRGALAYAMEHRGEAEQYYHISSKVSDIVPLDQRSNEELPMYLEEDAARQTLHITYGLLLAEEFFRAPFFACLEAHENLYSEFLAAHMGKHLEGLFERLQ